MGRADGTVRDDGVLMMGGGGSPVGQDVYVSHAHVSYHDPDTSHEAEENEAYDKYISG